MSSSKPPPPPPAATAAAAAPNQDGLLAQRLTLMDQLTNIYSFPSSAAEAAIDALAAPDSMPDVTECCTYILEQGLAPDAGGPVIPKDDCPHVSSRVTLRVEQLPIQPGSTICQHHPSSTHAKAGSLKGEITSDGSCPGTENWLCLTCGVAMCSRYVNGHALQHWQETKTTMNDDFGHCVAVSLSDLSVWCHACNSYIVNSSLQSLQAELERRKFPTNGSTTTSTSTEKNPGEPHPKRQRSGTLSAQTGTEEMLPNGGSTVESESHEEEPYSSVPSNGEGNEKSDNEGSDSQGNEDNEGESLGEEDEEALFQMITEAARAQGIPLQWILSQMHGVPIQAHDEGPVEYPWDNVPQTLPEIAEFIKSDRCKRILVLAGAGMSVASGIPDFRSANGLYATLNVSRLTCTDEEQRETIRKDPSAALDQHLFLENPLPCLESQREFILGTHEQRWKATLAHRFVELLAHKTGKLVRLYTQNIDGLEDQCTRLPTDKVIAVHGSMDRAECASCGATQDFEVFCRSVETQIKDITLEDPTAPSESTPIRCSQCNAPAVKPAIVLFRSSLPRVFFEKVPEDIQGIDLLIVVGTSLKVAPANTLVWRVPRSALRLLVNREIVGEHLGLEFGEDSQRDVFAEGDIEPVLLDLMEELGWLEDMRDLLNGTLPESSTEMLQARLDAAAPIVAAAEEEEEDTAMTEASGTKPSPPEVNEPVPSTTETAANEPEKCTNDDDPFSLKVKKQYILDARPESLPPISAEEALDDRDKQKKKRPKDQKVGASQKLCHKLMLDGACPFGESCKFSHDIKMFLANRPDDISELEGGCPIFALHGSCPYGVMCRFGKTHINMDTGENLRQTSEIPPPPPVKNILPKDVQVQLRKRTYHFKCKRFNEKKGETPTVANSDMAPIPEKRKLIDFSNKVYIAPLTTVGNLPFRRIMKRFGADITCGEMALTPNLLQGQSSEWALLKRHPDEDIFGVQITAGYPDQFTRIAEVIEATMDVDFVDLNLGCPLDLVCNKGSGAALMRRDKNLFGGLQGMAKVLSCPITIKMRTGWDIKRPFAHELVPKIQKLCLNDTVAAVMVHGRSRLQRYGKLADWDYINKVALRQSVEYPRLHLIGNGDIFSYTDYEEKVSREGVSSCAMLARGALIKPWLPTEIKERRHWDISATERLDILKDFVKFGLEHWGTDQQGVNNCRRFLLEWLSFLHRYVPVGLLEVVPQQMNQRPPLYMCGRNDLETLMMSPHAPDWIRISEMLLGPVPDGFRFEPKHKARGYTTK